MLNIYGNATECLKFDFRFIYETEHHNGIAELLEILGRYVSTFKSFQEELNETFCPSVQPSFSLLFCLCFCYFCELQKGYKKGLLYWLI